MKVVARAAIFTSILARNTLRREARLPRLDVRTTYDREVKQVEWVAHVAEHPRSGAGRGPSRAASSARTRLAKLDGWQMGLRHPDHQGLAPELRGWTIAEIVQPIIVKRAGRSEDRRARAWARCCLTTIDQDRLAPRYPSPR